MSDKRKSDHIDLTFSSRPDDLSMPSHMYYEPLLSGHPKGGEAATEFLGHKLSMPLWISSMTGGTLRAKKINENLARACGEFQIGMGLGSCRSLLSSDDRLEDFDVRQYMGEAPLFTNFGVAQIEELIEQKALDKILDVTSKLKADGVIIHVNPLQEWAQPEGDRFKRAPLESIQKVCEVTDIPVIVKEVGQGMGPKSLNALCQLPVSAIELAAFGGTNFTLIEQARHDRESSGRVAHKNRFGLVGHSPQQMIQWLNSANATKPIIISGGITDPLQGHTLRCAYQGQSIVGMASEVLKYAMNDYQELRSFLVQLKEQFEMATCFIEGE
ncbi:MAG: type 2 isopentenyl-diphosphate Delta-isomerase [Halobacteriovoraceae bacterium]|nr:type 2 isopentenyl-diphosphate Delta-isomerase [Halobacteriovoraceae bacterium]|tara:strand:+ start:5656 stop:6639 length:984 start_codon:yes stop_codon:yes gene_type:complete